MKNEIEIIERSSGFWVASKDGIVGGPFDTCKQAQRWMNKNVIDPSLFTTYHVTGKTTNGERFKIVTGNIMHAMGINLWNGHVWGIRVDNGKRQLLKTVSN